MSGPFDASTELVRAGNGRDGAWEFIARFAARWSSPITEDDGISQATLRAAEDRLGLSLPTALVEAYGLLGRRTDLTSNQDVLLGPDEIRVDHSGEVLVLRVENQECARWGVRVADLAHTDPPVVWEDTSATPPQGWSPFLDRLSLACVDVVLSESLFAAGDLGDNRELDTGSVETLERSFARLPLPAYPFWANPNGAPTRWFAGPDVVLRDDGRSWLWVRARTPAALDATRQTLPGDWVNRPPRRRPRPPRG